MFSRAGAVRPVSSSLPGTVTIRWLEPSIVTCAPTTPEPLTRLVMICWACFIDDEDGALPSSVSAVSVIWVPPCRSIPSFGEFDPSVKNTNA